MKTQRKAILAALAGAALLAGCATDPYYDNYGYGYSGYNYGYANPSYYGPSYYGPAYVAPSVGLGLSYQDYDYRRDGRWHRDDRDRRIDRVDPQASVVRPNEWRDSNGEIRDSQGRTAADRDRAANSASGG